MLEAMLYGQLHLKFGANKALCWAVENGIMQGDGGKLNPKDTASRAEAAALIGNLHQAQQTAETTGE